MKTYKVYYNSKRVNNNFLFVNANTAKEARNNFNDVYINECAGDITNVLKINKVERYDKNYKVKFVGRLKNAIGKFYLIMETVNAPKDATRDEILLKLYDKYEHIQQPKILNYE